MKQSKMINCFKYITIITLLFVCSSSYAKCESKIDCLEWLEQTSTEVFVMLYETDVLIAEVKDFVIKNKLHYFQLKNVLNSGKLLVSCFESYKHSVTIWDLDKSDANKKILMKKFNEFQCKYEDFKAVINLFLNKKTI